MTKTEANQVIGVETMKSRIYDFNKARLERLTAQSGIDHTAKLQYWDDIGQWKASKVRKEYHETFKVYTEEEARQLKIHEWA